MQMPEARRARLAKLFRRFEQIDQTDKSGATFIASEILREYIIAMGLRKKAQAMFREGKIPEELSSQWMAKTDWAWQLRKRIIKLFPELKSDFNWEQYLKKLLDVIYSQGGFGSTIAVALAAPSEQSSSSLLPPPAALSADFDSCMPIGPSMQCNPGAVPGTSNAGDQEAVNKDKVYPVWFGTDRKPTPNGNGFTSERNHQITRGRAEVFIPAAHRFGETGSSFWKRLLRFDLRDDTLLLQRVTQQDLSVFYEEVSADMEKAKEGNGTSHALIYLHGFNVTFEQAAIQAAQIGSDLKVPGVTAFFSWPSRGEGIKSYLADEATIETSEQAITDFLVEFVANAKADKVHIIAHSMGNRGLLRSFQRIASNSQAQGNVKFGQIFLAAPDIDRDLFIELAQHYSPPVEGTTLYASNGDKALYLSKKLHDAPRAGYYKPYTIVPNMTTIAVPNFNIDLLGHSYYAKAEPLLYDIRELMLHGTAPASRIRVRETENEGKKFWVMMK